MGAVADFFCFFAASPFFCAVYKAGRHAGRARDRGQGVDKQEATQLGESGRAQVSEGAGEEWTTRRSDRK
jgi:hypothetical protein